MSKTTNYQSKLKRYNMQQNSNVGDDNIYYATQIQA